MSGKKAKHQILVNKATIIPYKCDNFVAIVVPGLSSDTNISGLAGDAAENTQKVSTERPACKAGIEKSIARLARMVCRIYGTPGGHKINSLWEWQNIFPMTTSW